jgi:hypothetical protein
MKKSFAFGEAVGLTPFGPRAPAARRGDTCAEPHTCTCGAPQVQVGAGDGPLPARSPPTPEGRSRQELGTMCAGRSRGALSAVRLPSTQPSVAESV